MRHLLFPTSAQADAFVQDLQSQGVIQPEMGQTSLGRRGMSSSSTGAMSSGGMSGVGSETGQVNVVEGGTAEDAGVGAVKGTGVGAAVGTVAGVVATVATGGLAAVPVILGMAALGSGVGAGVGAVGGAAGVDETGDGRGAGSSYASSYELDDDRHDRLDQGVSTGGRAIAVDDSVPADIVEAAAARHGGQFV